MANIPRIAITATEEKYKDINATAGGTPGFEKFERGGLDKVRDYLGSAQAWGYHSVPSSIAPLLVLDRAAKDWSKANIRNKEGNWDHNLDAWLGTICAYLFYGKTGQKLCLTHDEVEAWPNGKRPVDTRANADKRVNPEQSYIRALKLAGRKPMKEASGETGEIWRLTYLNVKQGDKLYRFALLDEQLMLVPLPLEPATQEIMKRNIEWYITKADGSGGQTDNWSQVTRFLFSTYPVYGQLLLSLLNKLIDEDLIDDNTEYPKKHFVRLRNFVKANVAEPEDAATIKKRKYIPLSSVWIAELPSAESRPSFYDAFLKNVPESGVPSDEEIWTENAVLLPLTDNQAKALENNFLCEPVQASKAGEVKEHKLYLLPPLREEIYNYLIERGAKPKLSLNYSDDLELTVTISFGDDDGMQHMRKHVYSLGKTKTLWLLDSLPYLSLWPNVNLPVDKWKLYYVFRSCAASASAPMQTLLNAIVTRDDTRRQLELTYYQKSQRYLQADDIQITVDGNSGQIVSSAFTDGTAKENGPYSVFQTKTRPELIELKSADGRTFANLRLKKGPPEVEIIEDKKATLSLDFGTSATLLYFKADGEKEPKSIQSGSQYVLDLMPFQSEQNRNNFDRFHGVLKGKSRQGLGKINSVAQNNEFVRPIDRNNVRPYIQGRYVLLDHYVWSNIKKQNDNKLAVNPELPHQALLLDKYGIYSGLKFPSKDDDGEKIRDALYVFFSNLLVLAALHARLEGVNKVTMRVACPNQVALANLRSVLQPVFNDSNENFFGKLFNNRFQAYEEAHAVCAYLREYRPNTSRLSDALGAVIVDIGGGTTDICVVKDRKTETVSFGLAGDRLIRRTIVYSTTKDVRNHQRVYNPGTTELKQFLTERAPDDVNDDNLMQYLSAYESIVKLQGSNESAQEKIYYKDLAELVDIVMQRYPPRYDRVTDPETLIAHNFAEANAADALTCLADTIKLRYILLFYLLGAYLKQKAESLELSSWNEVRIYLAGFGSRGLGFCCGEDMRKNHLNKCRNSLPHRSRLLRKSGQVKSRCKCVKILIA